MKLMWGMGVGGLTEEDVAGMRISLSPMLGVIKPGTNNAWGAFLIEGEMMKRKSSSAVRLIIINARRNREIPLGTEETSSRLKD